MNNKASTSRAIICMLLKTDFYLCNKHLFPPDVYLNKNSSDNMIYSTAPLQESERVEFIAFLNGVRVNTNYRKLLQSCVHHEEGIQHLTLGQLKPQLGFIKQERERCLASPVEIGRWNWFTAQTHQNSSACYFCCALSTTT